MATLTQSTTAYSTNKMQKTMMPVTMAPWIKLEKTMGTMTPGRIARRQNGRDYGNHEPREITVQPEPFQVDPAPESQAEIDGLESR